MLQNLFRGFLTWKDVITDIINLIIPPSNRIFYKFIAAIIATLIIIIAIYFILGTESEAEKVIRILGKKKQKKQFNNKKSI